MNSTKIKNKRIAEILENLNKFLSEDESSVGSTNTTTNVGNINVRMPLGGLHARSALQKKNKEKFETYEISV